MAIFDPKDDWESLSLRHFGSSWKKKPYLWVKILSEIRAYCWNSRSIDSLSKSARTKFHFIFLLLPITLLTRTLCIFIRTKEQTKPFVKLRKTAHNLKCICIYNEDSLDGQWLLSFLWRYYSVLCAKFRLYYWEICVCTYMSIKEISINVYRYILVRSHLMMRKNIGCVAPFS